MGKARIDLKPRVMVEDVRAMGPGKADLLALIESEGSISGAAKAMKMSYRRAWLLVEAMNGAFKLPLVSTAAGGAGGGGARLTDEGRAMLDIYRRMQASVAEAAASFEQEFGAHVR
ncbi:MAG: LysR family transcriptional regulator [Caulobacteraceae bacterium]